MGALQQFCIPIIVILVVRVLVVAMALFSRNYIKVPPNAVAVLSGRKRKTADGKLVGYRVVNGGATFRFPLLEQVDYLSLNVFTIPLEIKRAYTLKGVPISVKAVANVKIKSDDISLRAAAERFLGMPPEQIQRVIFQTLEGHLRAILGTLTVEEVNSDRQSFAQKLTSEAATDLERMGIGVDVLTVQEITDEEGYLDALGKKRTAEVKRDAIIGEAEATHDSKIRSAQALQEGEQAKLLAEAEQEKWKQEGMGRASAVEAEGRATASKIEAVGLAQARAIEAQGVAEAQAILKKAEAWKEFNEAAKLQTILEKLPSVLQASAGIFGAVAAPLGNIDKVVVIEQGNGGGDGMGGIGRVARAGPALVFGLLQQLQALGLDIPTVLSQLGADGGKLPAAAKPAEVAPAPPPHAKS